VEASVPSASAVGELPVAVDDVMRVALAKDPEKRPATSEELLDALEDALDSDDFAPAAPPTAVTAHVPPARAATTGSLRAQPVRVRRRWPGLAALAALAVVAGAAIAIAAGTGGGSKPKPTTAPHAAKAKPKTQAQSTQTATQAQSTATQAQTTTPPPTPQQQAQAKADNPVALNNSGYSLILAGKPTEAVTPLQRSVEAFRAQQRTSEIDYAYALYNLGNALRLSGQPAAAIPYLQERLRISNYKRGVVKKELQTAQSQA
jgi:serine/threonine-protein kinase